MFKVKEVLIPIKTMDTEGIEQGDFYKIIDKKSKSENLCVVRRAGEKGIHFDYIKTPNFDLSFSELYVNVENIEYINDKYIFVKMKLIEDKESEWLGNSLTLTTDPSIEYREALVALEKEIIEAMRPIEQINQMLMKRFGQRFGENTKNHKQLREIEEHAKKLEKGVNIPPI